MDVPFGEWLPDQPARNNPGAILAKNCIPEDSFYRDFKSLASFSSALGDQARGNYWVRAASGAVSNFAADPDTLYLFDTVGGWDDVSKPANTYSANTWDFIHFQDRVIATDGASPVQYYDLGVSATFDDLPGSPPLARYVTVIRDFVVLGNYEIGSEREAGGYAWSGFNNTGLWTPSIATQSGRRRSRGQGGQVQRMIGGSRGLIFHENALRTLTYVGPPTIFKPDDITTLHGTPAPRSVAWTEDLGFYYSQEGFRQINRRTLELSAIGKFKVDQWFTENAAANDIVNMQGTVNRKRGLVMWAFRSSTSSAAFDRILVYNFVAQRWAYAELMTEYLGEFASVGYNLDTIGAVLGGNIDSASINVDSAAYIGGGLDVIAFNSSHQACTFDGAALTAEFDTREIEIAQGRKRLTVNGVRPLVESTTNPTIQIRAIKRDLQTANPSVGALTSVNAIGVADLRVNARYQRYRVRVAGGFTRAVGVQPNDPKARGSR